MGGGPYSRAPRSVPDGWNGVVSWVGPIATSESSSPHKLSSVDELMTGRSHPPYCATSLVQTHLGKRLYKKETLAEETNVEETNVDFLLEEIVIITSRVS